MFFVYLLLLSGAKREALNQVCFDETEPSEETSVRMLKMSDFYELKTNLPSNHPKRRAFVSAGASPLTRERRVKRY
jgi:hypothetical protein